jgi:hypothetical protein
MLLGVRVCVRRRPWQDYRARGTNVLRLITLCESICCAIVIPSSNIDSDGWAG